MAPRAGGPMRHTELFDDGWSVLVGDLEPSVARNTAKTGTAGGPSDLTLHEGAEPPVPDGLRRFLGEAGATRMFGTAPDLDAAWTPVDLPDDWTTRSSARAPENVTRAANLGDAGVRGGFLPVGTAWYRKVFDVPGDWDGQRIALEFDGVMRDAHVWLNGSFIGSHYSGYTGFALDITEFLRYGDEGRNVVLVRCDTTSTEAWWAEGGGIYRHVRLVATSPVRIARHGVFVHTLFLDPERAVVRVHTDVENDQSSAVERVVVEHQVVSPPLHTLARVVEAERLAGFGSTTVSQDLELAEPSPWSPSSPVLYELETRLVVGDEVTDAVVTTFGVRTVEYGPDGLVLNGAPLTIKGTCNHQDFAGVGIALPDRVHEYKIAELQELGCNAYRSAHHPPAPEILDACDRHGLLVLDENRRLESNDEGLADLTELIRRDRNHPSVFMWCLENEELIATTPMARRLARRLVDMAHHLDPTRLTTIAGQFAKDDPRYMSIPDVAGFNYDRGNACAYRAVHPGAPVMATEDASFVSTCGVYEDQPDLGLCSSHDTGSFIERMAAANGVGLGAGTAGGALATEFGHLTSTWLNLLEHPYLGGVFVWTGFDYRGECVPFGWPAVTSSFGLMDLCGFPKDISHYWRSRWTDAPVLHLLPHWNWEGREGAPILVEAYTNCEAVELSLNGRSLGTSAVERDGVIHWTVGYEPGMLEARASRNGNVVASAVRETTGAPSAIELDADEPTCCAGGRDVVIVRAAIVDSAGRVVPTANPVLDFSADAGAAVLGTGNGSPADPPPAASSRRRAFNGHALAIVRGPRTTGTFSISATSPGLEDASVVVRAEP